MSESTEPLCDRISHIAEELEYSAGDLRGMPGVSRLRAALPDAVAALRHIADLVLEQGVELDELRTERELLGAGEVQQHIVTPGGLIYPPSERDLALRDHWLPGVRLERRTVYGTPWEPADPKQIECKTCGARPRVDMVLRRNNSPVNVGPCVKVAGHGGSLHEDGSGLTWEGR